MLEKVRNCTKCLLCCNQKPLMDDCADCEIFWVGLSAKKALDGESPLSENTNSGAIIHKIEEQLEGISTYKTNLVKCLPLDNNCKLRYPNKHEIDDCFNNLREEILTLSPKIVFLLGEKVYTSVGKHLNLSFERFDGFNYSYVKYEETYYIPIHHPSYIYVYKRKYIDEYVRSVYGIVETLLSNEMN